VPESIYGSIAETTKSDVSAAKVEGATKKKESDYAVPIPLEQQNSDNDSDTDGEVEF
jgi:hypothetical protein